MQVDLTNKNVLVTGASRGIGKAIATHMSEAGAGVALHYNTQTEQAHQLASQLDNKALVFQADLADPNQAVELFDQVVATMGHLNVIVNNAGIAISSSLEKEDQAWMQDWNDTMQVNLNTTALLCKKAVTHFEQQGGGRIINISSRAAFRGDTSDYLAYAASKGGMVTLTRSLARAFGKQGIKAFNIAPGFVRTDMAQEFMDQYGEEIAIQDIALQKLTEPKDVAPMVVFLASGLADHATGCTIDINAGSYVH
ncbi:MAG: SDR family NAD(P)-dependent oxidoreductase [Cyclobacteriaceae bacterium]